jgi:hypothetical protein
MKRQKIVPERDTYESLILFYSSIKPANVRAIFEILVELNEHQMDPSLVCEEIEK